MSLASPSAQAWHPHVTVVHHFSTTDVRLHPACAQRHAQQTIYNARVTCLRAASTAPTYTCCTQHCAMHSSSQSHCSCSDLFIGSRRPFTDHLLRHNRRAGPRTHRGGRCHAAWRSDGPSHDAATDSVVSSESPDTRSYHRSQQFVEVSAAPAPPQQQLSAFLGTPKGAATAIALAGVTGLGLRALFSRGSR
jgi:hypothetical protein